jgi:uncharacterized protein (TIGR02099 family)
MPEARRSGGRWVWPWLLLFSGLALYGAGGRLALASLETQQQAVLQAVAQALEMPLTAERIRGRMQGFSPVLELQGLRVGPASAPALTADALSLELDVLESLYRGLPIARQLSLGGLAVYLERDGDSLRLRGLPPAPASKTLPQSLLRAVFHADGVSLEGATITLEGAESWRLRGELRDGWLWHRGLLAFQTVGDDGPRGTLSYELRGDPLTEGEREGRVQGRLNRLDRERLRPWLTTVDALPQGALEDLAFEGAFEPQAGFQFRLAAQAPVLQVTETVKAEALSLELFGQRLGRERGSLWLRTLQGRLAGVPVSFSDAALAWRRGVAPELRLFLPELSLRTAAELVAAWPDRPKALDSWLQRLALDGRLRDLRLRLNPDAPRASLALEAEIQDLRATAYRGMPTVRGLDGRFQATVEGATFTLASGPFYLHFPRVFAAGWQYDEGSGELALRWTPEALELEGRKLALKGEAASAEGQFALRLTPEEAGRRLALAVDFQEADALFLGAYLPEKLEPGLRSWLLDSIRGGRVGHGQFVLYGPFKPERPTERSASLALDLSEGRLRPAPRWPELAQLEGRMWLEPEAVYGTLRGGSLSGLSLSEGAFSLPAGPTPRRLELTARGRGTGEGLLNFLKTAPLGPGLAFLQEDWAAAGPVALDLDLAMVLGQPPERLQVATALEGVALAVGRSRLTLDDLAGTVTYRYPGTLAAQELTGSLFDGPFRAAIAGSLEDAGLAFAGEGTLRGQALAQWLRIPYLDGVQGALSYTADLRIDGTGGLDLSARSEALDLQTGLPAPLDARDSVLDLRYTQSDLGETPAAKLQLGWGGLSARASFEDGSLVSAALGIDAPLPPEPAYGVTVQGRVSRFALDPWLTRVASFPEAPADAGGASALPLAASLRLDEALWGDAPFGAGQLVMAGQVSAPYFVFAFPSATGALAVQGDRSLDLRLAALQWPPEGEGLDAAAPLLAEAAADHGVAPAPAAPEDPFSLASLGDLSPESWPPLRLRIDQLSLFGEAYEGVAFTLAANETSLVLGEFEAQGRGLTLGARDDGVHQLTLTYAPTLGSRYEGRISGQNFADALSAFGFLPTVESENFAFDMDLSWPGGPEALTLKDAEGTVDFGIDRGRFLQIDAAGAPMRVLGLLNFSALARRLRFDFSDVYKRGLVFDELQGAFNLEAGQLRTDGPVRMRGPSSRFQLAAAVDLASYDLTGDLVVTLPVGNNLPWAAAYAALLANPLAGAGVLVAERLFRDQIDRFSSARYLLGGKVDAPELTFDSIFEVESTLPPEEASGKEDAAPPEAEGRVLIDTP